MDLVPLPNKIQYQQNSETSGVVSVSPCFKGFGTTLGNALRRVLLSSMPGCAVTALKIKGVDHEFSTIPGVKEDVVDVILNFKKLRLKLHTDEEVRFSVKISKEGELLAGSLEVPAEVEIVNKDLVLFTVSDAKDGVELEIFANKGKGFVPTEIREKEKQEVGVVAIDSIYTPIRNVGYRVENVRVGQMTNYEKVILDIETDGTIDALEASKMSAKILVDHFSLFAQDDLLASGSEEVAKEEAVEAEDSSEEE